MKHRCACCVSYMLHDFGHHGAPACIRYLVSSVSLLFRLFARYEEDHGLARQLTLPEEDRAKYTSARWEGVWQMSRRPAAPARLSNLQGRHMVARLTTR